MKNAQPYGSSRLAAATIILFGSCWLATPASAELTTCSGPIVTRLAGPHAITRQPILDLAALQRRLPQLEASIRAVVAKDPSLGPSVADALIAAIKTGSVGITERVMARQEKVLWMAHQPEPGRIEAITTACLRLERDYDAFEIAVAIAEPAVPVAAPTCAITAERDCAASNPSIRVDLGRSSPGARVTLTTNAQPAIAVGDRRSSFSVPDPGPYEIDAVFTVKNSPEPLTTKARVYRFLMPKICGNLAYLGEGPSQTMPQDATATLPLGCEARVQVERCERRPPNAGSGPVVPPQPTPYEDLACDEGWKARIFLFGYFPSGNDQERDLVLAGRPADERFSVESGYGIGASVERRYGKVLGIEAAVLVGRGDSEYRIDIGNDSEVDTHRVNFFALTAGPNFHLLGCAGADFYVGPFVGYGGFGDPNYWAFDHHFRASFDGRFLWGAQIGLDLPFADRGHWGFHGGLRYFSLSQDTDAGSLEVDPLIVEAGLAYRF